MPFIKAKVSCPVSSEQESELKAGMGKTIELVPGKSEDIIAWRIQGMYIDRNQYR